MQRTSRILALAVASGLLVTLAAGTASADVVETMTLSSSTGKATLGADVTVAFKAGETPVGTYYDVWACPDQSVRPIDLLEVGECQPLTFWNRGEVNSYDQATSALSMTWLLTNTPQPGRDPQGTAYLSGSDPILMDPPGWDGDAGAITEGEGWCDYSGWYLIVNDYDGGAHSNWLEIDADACAADEQEGLPPTGSTSGPLTVGALLAVLLGAAFVTLPRLRRS